MIAQNFGGSFMKRLVYLLSLIFLVGCASHYRDAALLSTIPNLEVKRSTHEAFGNKFMISSQGDYSTEIGKKIFMMGGNAFDAFTAVSFAIGVERPQSTGLGGGGFLLFKTAKMAEPTAVDFREKAPLRAHRDMFLDKNGKVLAKKSLDGIFAVGVPGLVAGVLEIHRRYGKLPLEKVLAPVADFAAKGFKVYPEMFRALKHRKDVLAQFPATKKIFFRDGRPLQVGELCVQKDLAKSIRLIAKQGRRAFYKGRIAKQIVKESQRLNGMVSLKDMASYNVVYRAPVKGTYHGDEIYSMSPPSSGGTHVVEILNMVEKDGLKASGFLSPRHVHLVASAMQQAFADRAKYLGDADFVTVPVKGLTSKKYASQMRAAVQESKAKKIELVVHGNPFPYESSETTHFTIADNEGNVLTTTQTINGWFGSGVIAPGTGILLNNEMDDFAAQVGASNLFGAVGGENNLVEAQKRPLSSMSPTIVLRKKKPLLALGTPSGTRILTCVAQTMLNYLEFKKPLYEAVGAVRFHHQWSPDYIRFDEVPLDENLVDALEDMGHTVKQRNLGCRIQAIAFENGKLHGVSDPRGEGNSQGDL